MVRNIWIVLGLTATLLLLWALNSVILVGQMTYWITVVAVPIMATTFWFRRYRHGRLLILRGLDNYWWIWVPAVTLALVSTTLIGIASLNSLVVPMFSWGLRGTPWAYIYFINLVIWSGVMLLMACFHSKFRDDLGRYLHNWAGRGGCWKIWSTDNAPANRLCILYLLVVYIAFIYGWPTPSIDAEMELYEARQVMQPYATLINRWTEDIVGLTVLKSRTELSIKPEGRYIKGWFWIKTVLFLTPLVVFGLVMSRRDGAAALFDRSAAYIAKRQGKREASASSPRQEQQTTPPLEAKPQTAVEGQGVYGTQLGREIIAEGTVRFGEVALQRGLQWLSQVLKRAKR